MIKFTICRSFITSLNSINEFFAQFIKKSEHCSTPMPKKLKILCIAETLCTINKKNSAQIVF